MRHLFFIIALFCIVPVSAQTVYYTPSGAKFHTSNCRMVENVAHKTTTAKAFERGLTPCKICKPQVSTHQLGIYSGAGKKTNGSNEQTTRCRGTTKAGTRCKHMTRIGNGYCAQHQP